ncbi:hypothetical protein WJX74_004476 [Apatococcus lobatus]|uniref:ABC transporter domain-containing protein n=1 Tax=Apatococcus lobatus TaxID=904363 RepID=A0AAW1QZ03_9CHLO
METLPANVTAEAEVYGNQGRPNLVTPRPSIRIGGFEFGLPATFAAEGSGTAERDQIELEEACRIEEEATGPQATASSVITSPLAETNSPGPPELPQLNSVVAKLRPDIKQRAQHVHATLSFRQKLAEEAFQMGAGGTTGKSFLQTLVDKLAAAGLKPPTVTVEYQKLNVEADALVGSANIPSLTNVFAATLKSLVGLGGLDTAPLAVLKDVQGVLKPGRITLLLGPPGSGKSAFMQVLAGRMKATSFLRVSGDLRYNGVRPKDFNIARTAAYVHQFDSHIAGLTVHETLTFARACQVPNDSSGEFNAFTELRRNAGNLDKSSTALLGGISKGKGAPSDLSPLGPRPRQDKAAAGRPDAEDGSASGGIAAYAGPAEASGSTEDHHDVIDKLMQSMDGAGIVAEFIIRVLGLTNCADTPLGNEMIRGVSGGERKRVTLGEMLVGNKRVMMLDEISTGLDSATTYSIVRQMAEATHLMGLTPVISLLQPPPEVYELFDDVILLTDGQVCFHGPVKEAASFFRSLGFECPVRKDVANFLQEVTTPKGQLTYATPELRTAHGFPASDEEVSDLLHGPAPPMLLEALAHSNYALPRWDMIKLLTDRQWKLFRRDKALTNFRVMQVIVVGLIVGSLFGHLGHTPDRARSYFGVSFLCIMFLAMGSAIQMAIIMQTKGIFFKQRDARFYPASAYVLGQTFTQMPFALLEAALFSAIVYFWVGFEASASCFFLFYFIIVCAILMQSCLFRMLACICPNMVLANAGGSVLLLVLIVSSGFVLVRKSIPGWWIWAYYMSPFAYALRAVVINEMRSPNWQQPNNATVVGGPTVGEAALQSFEFQTETVWIWYGIAFLLGCIALLMAVSVLGLTWISPAHARPSVAVVNQSIAAKRASRDHDKMRQKIERRLSKKTEGDIEEARAEPGPVEMSALSRAPTGLQMSLKFEPITLVFKDLRYSVPLPAAHKPQAKTRAKQKASGLIQPTEMQALSASASPGAAAPMGRLELLKGITGYATPGNLQALMGGSGAGKTTLMDVIAGRKTQGKITGDILVNGYPKDQKSWSRVVGYVEQMDIHSAQATVHEALIFSARMRLDQAVSNQQVTEYVEDVLTIMELDTIRGLLVGIPGQDGLSVEQRKRLTIAVELVANPSIVFMDEPTSGLDARAAAIVMRCIKNVSRSGRSILVTIHQPSIEIFETFDSLVLLQRGGRLIYLGPLGVESCQLVDYLRAQPGVVPLKQGHNPATWMLEVTGGAVATSARAAPLDFAAAYQAGPPAESELYQQNQEMVRMLSEEGRRDHQPLTLSSQYATNYWIQSKWLMAKYLVAYWRSPSYNLTRICMTAVIALLYGTFFYKKAHVPAEGAKVGDVQNVLGVLYSSTIFQGNFNYMTVLPVVAYERAVFYRERSSSMYAAGPYSSATAIVEIPYLVSQMCVFMPISYFMIGFELSASKFFFYALVFLLSLTTFTLFGQLLVFVTPHVAVAQILGSSILLLWSMFNGFMIPYPQMPQGWKWLNRICPPTWVIYALSINQLGDKEQELTGFGTGSATPITIKAWLKSYFGYEYDFRWYCVLIIFAFVVAFRVLAVMAVRYISFQKR